MSSRAVTKFKPPKFMLYHVSKEPLIEIDDYMST